MIENVARGGHPRTVPHTKMSSKGRIELRISQSRAKIDQEVAGDVRFRVAPQKSVENKKKRFFSEIFSRKPKTSNGRKIARMAPILTIFGPNRSRRRDLFFENFSNERRRHRGIVVVVIVAVVVAVVVVIGRFSVACIKGTSLHHETYSA